MNSLSEKTVLVTGANGFIGKHLVNRLVAVENVRIILLDRVPVADKPTDALFLCSSFEDLSQDAWRDVGVDRLDLVFHLGAFTPKSALDADRVEEVYQSNLLGTRFLLDSLPAVPQRIVFSSTLDVYASPPPNQTLHEESPLGPSGLYGASKLFCEQLVRVHARAFGYDCAILRYGHIYGPGEDAYAKLIPQLIRRLLGGQAPVLYGDGSVERDFMYVEDVVEATVRAALTDNVLPGPVNIVRGMSVSIRAIAETLVRLTGFAGEIEYLSDEAPGHSLRFDNRLMRDFLGAWDLVSLEEGLRREIGYFRSLANE